MSIQRLNQALSNLCLNSVILTKTVKQSKFSVKLTRLKQNQLRNQTLPSDLLSMTRCCSKSEVKIANSSYLASKVSREIASFCFLIEM